ncbi:MAG: hypothetical protein ACXWPI_03490, partial [Ktedonobacterales bacterium]
MPTNYESTFERAKLDFARKVTACTTQDEAAALAAEVAQNYAMRASGSVENYLWMLNDNPSLIHRHAVRDELEDCETIADILYVFLENDLTAAL